MLTFLRAQATRPLAVIMITGQPSEELQAEFLAQGNEFVLTTHFLTKPVQFERLEPIVLAAHEEVLAAKRRLREKEATGPGSTMGGAGEPLPDLAGRLAALESELRAQRSKWRRDFWKVAFVLFLFWLAGQFGLVQKVEPHWARAKAAVWHQVDLWKANREAAERKAAPSEPAAVDPASGSPDTPKTEPSPAKAATLPPAPAL
jgi:CheY-like chemotaxis protein